MNILLTYTYDYIQIVLFFIRFMFQNGAASSKSLKCCSCLLFDFCETVVAFKIEQTEIKPLKRRMHTFIFFHQSKGDDLLAELLLSCFPHQTILAAHIFGICNWYGDRIIINIYVSQTVNTQCQSKIAMFGNFGCEML